MRHILQIVTLAVGLCIFIDIVPRGEAFAEAQKEKEETKGLIAFDFSERSGGKN